MTKHFIKQGKGKIDWCDYSINYISGECQHGCEYCYMHSIWKRFPELREYKLRENYLSCDMPKKPSKIFVGSSTDMWGDWVPKDDIHQVFRKIRKHPEHTYQFLTKNPERYFEFDFSDFENCWFGTTMDGTEKTKDNISALACAFDHYNNPHIKRFVSFEPLLEPIQITEEFIEDFQSLSWIIIGADSSKGAKKPHKGWADTLISLARVCNVPIWVKDNYGYPEIIKEFPDK